MTNLRKVIYKNTEIEFYHTIKKVKNINMRVKSDQTVTVSSSNRVSLSKIDQFVLQNAEFVLKSREKFANKLKNITENYANGENFFFLGNSYKINIILSQTEFAEIKNSTFNIYTREISDKNTKIIAENFINQQCYELFSTLIQKYLKIFEPLGVIKPTLKIKSVKSRWGSCTPSKNEIMLNKKLIHFDINCIEYVVIHEFCHFFHQNHSKDFYNFLEKFMPDYKIYKNQLNNKE